MTQPFATVTPLREWMLPPEQLPSASPISVVRPSHLTVTRELAEQIHARLEAGTLLIDCPCCGEAMMTKRDKRGMPYAYCYACRHDIAGRTAPSQRYWYGLAVARLMREAEAP